MSRAGVAGRAALMISGHKTPPVFDRFTNVGVHDQMMNAARHPAGLDSPRGRDFGSSLRHHDIRPATLVTSMTLLGCAQVLDA